MTPEQHKKFLGIAHWTYAGLYSLMGIFMAVIILLIASTPSSPRDNPTPLAFDVMMAVLILGLMIGWVIPSIIAGYALLKRKSWAKTAMMVAAAFAVTQVPIGSAVAIYTFWFVFGETGRSLYEPPPKPSLVNPRPYSAGTSQEA